MLCRKNQCQKTKKKRIIQRKKKEDKQESIKVSDFRNPTVKEEINNKGRRDRAGFPPSKGPKVNNNIRQLQRLQTQAVGTSLRGFGKSIKDEKKQSLLEEYELRLNEEESEAEEEKDQIIELKELIKDKKPKPIRKFQKSKTFAVKPMDLLKKSVFIPKELKQNIVKELESEGVFMAKDPYLFGKV